MRETPGPSSPRKRAVTVEPDVGAADDDDDNDDDADDVYCPPRGLDARVEMEMEMGAEEEADEEVEAGVLAWGLLVVGGLGVAAAGILGGTVSA